MELDQHFPCHNISKEETADRLNTDSEKGLSKGEVNERKSEIGENKLPEKGKATALLIFLKQFKDLLILILFIAAAISWYIGHMTDVYVILGIILFNAVIGFIQEYKAEKAIESIKSMVRHTTNVIRDGNMEEVPATEIVPGDLIKIEEGETIPADARLLEVKNLQVIEAPLTGESVPSDKKAEEIDEEKPLADRTNMVYKSTHVARGTGKAIVTATAENTEIGKIATSITEMEATSSAFKDKTNLLGKQMAAFAVISSALVFIIGYFFRNFDMEGIFMVTIATLVSSIPEGLPVVISIVLAIGAKRMADRNAIIREFTATEMLGSVTTILADKTGTITQSILTVKKMFINKDLEVDVAGEGYDLEGEITSGGENIELNEDPRMDKMALIAAYCNSAQIKENNSNEEADEGGEDADGEKIEVTGDPTEAALLILGKKIKVHSTKPFNELEKVDDLPFNSEAKFRATLMQYPDGSKDIFVVGAPEKIADISSKIITGEGSDEFGNQDKEKAGEVAENYTENAMRIVALAHKPVDQNKNTVDEEDVHDLVWTGIAGIVDPPREGVKESILKAKDAGIRVIMLTGDHENTAKSIAQSVSIIEEDEEAISFAELKEDEENFGQNVESANVFARVDPDTKLKITEHLQDKGALVGMTGDGINDAPALKRADVGIAMGQRGTDVAKDASHIVLSDDNFSTIVNAVREGRIVFNNVRNTSYFLLTTNFAQVLAIIFCISIGLPLPLLATQILWVNLVTDGVMDVALATEPGHGKVMDQEPYGREEQILKWNIIPNLMLIAFIMVVLTVWVFTYYLPDGEQIARTGAFLAISMTQLYNVLNLRSLEKSVFEIGIFSNKWINIAFITSLILQIGAVKSPFMRTLFRFENLPWLDFIAITLLSSAVLWGGELYKYLKYKE